MEKVTGTLHTAQLRHRRMEVEMTLRHLDTEKRQVESNTEWLNYAAYKSRVALLDTLTSWYRNEMAEIDKALNASSRTMDSVSAPLARNLSPLNAYSFGGK